MKMSINEICNCKIGHNSESYKIISATTNCTDDGFAQSYVDYEDYNSQPIAKPGKNFVTLCPTTHNVRINQLDN